MKGTQLLEIRRNLGLSQAAFALELGVSRTFVSLMERDLKPISRRTQLSALHLNGDTSEPVNQVNNVNPVNDDQYKALADTTLRIFSKLMIETNTIIEPFFLRSNSKEVRKLCDGLSRLHEGEIETLREYLSGMPDKELSSRLIFDLDLLVKLQKQRFAHL